MYNIKFAILTIFKCTAQWHQVHILCFATIIIIHIQNTFHLAKLKLCTLYPLNNNFLFLPSPNL